MDMLGVQPLLLVHMVSVHALIPNIAWLVTFDRNTTLLMLLQH